MALHLDLSGCNRSHRFLPPHAMSERAQSDRSGKHQIRGFRKQWPPVVDMGGLMLRARRCRIA